MKIKKTMAALTAATLCASTLPTGLAALSARAEDQSDVVASLPAWIPGDFETALEFANTYGSTHTDNGLICIVKSVGRTAGRSEDTYGYDLEASGVTGQKLRQEIYSGEDGYLGLQVFVYQPLKEGEVGLKLTDPHVQVPPMEEGEEFTPPTVADYTFTVGSFQQITETDIYGWLPDCCTEYDAFKKENGEISVKDNYVLFCQECGIGTAYSWRERDQSYKENMKCIDVQYCSVLHAEPLEGGSSNRIVVYQAIKDGSAAISWDLAPFALNNYEISKTQTAGCVILDEGQTVLTAKDARVRLFDHETGVPLTVDKDNSYAILYSFYDLHNNRVTADVTSNPCILRNLKYNLTDSVSLQMPMEYCIPTKENSNETAEDFMELTKYENGAADIVFRPSKKPVGDLPENTVRVTVLDKDTSEPIPAEIFEHHPFSFGMQYEIPVEGGWDYNDRDYKPTTNPWTFEMDLSGIRETARRFQIYGAEPPQIITYANGSTDLIFRTKIRVRGNINGDGDFNIADAVTLQNWLLGKSDTVLKNWEEADFTLDGQLDSFDLCLMLNRLAEREKNPPVALRSLTTGGVAGIHEVWEVYKDEDKYILTFENRRMENGKLEFEISEEEYNSIMLADYEGPIEADKYSRNEMIIDGFNYETVITYADGSEMTTRAQLRYVFVLLDNLLQKYRTEPIIR